MVLTYSERAQLHADCSIGALLAALRNPLDAAREESLYVHAAAHTGGPGPVTQGSHTIYDT